MQPTIQTTARSSKDTSPAEPVRTRGFYVIDWIETNCVFTNDRWIGQPFRFLPWQKRLVLELFQLRADGRRKYRWSYTSVPKKNGKTELFAALGLYLLIGDDEPAPKVMVAAASEDQADLLFNAASTMCQMSPTLKAVTEIFSNEIQVPSIPGATMKRVAAAAGTNDGKNISAVLIDELHEWVGEKGKNVWNVLTNGFGTRQQPLALQITTAGYDLETICGQQYLHAKGVLSGEIDDPRYHAFIMESDRDADWRDPAVWQAVNPSYGTTLDAEFFEDQSTKKPESVFRRYFLNTWVESEDLWLPPAAWENCAAPEVEPKKSRPAYVAIDFSMYHDTTAVVLAQRVKTKDKARPWRTVVRGRYWSNPYPRTDERHDRWVIPTAEVENYLRELYRIYRRPAALNAGGYIYEGPAFYYDPARFEQSAQTLLEEGLNMVAYDQTDNRMVPVAQVFYEQIATGTLAHDPSDRVLRDHVYNVIRHERPRGGWRMSKPKGSPKKIDGAIAAGIAVTEAQQDPPGSYSGATYTELDE